MHLWYVVEKRAYFVRNNGAGFYMSQAIKLFGLSQRLHSDPSVPGLGIGMAIATRIVERHGGWIPADSVPGTGTSFWINLPVQTTKT